MFGFTLFSTNIGDDYVSTKKIDSSLFTIALMLTLIFLLCLAVLIVVIIRQKRKMHGFSDKM